MTTVLVVDDNDDACRMMAALVRCCGYDGVCVSSGEAALTFVRSRAVDLMILDNMMPGMDGIEVLREIRGHPTTASVPVIMWSARYDPDFIEHARRKGATDYWVKASFDYSELGKRLAAVFRQRGEESRGTGHPVPGA